jgi:hypothetical protein
MKNRFGFDESKLKGTRFWRKPHLERRAFFKHVASGLAGYFLLPGRPSETVAQAAPTPIGTAENVVFMLLTGAPSHTDTFDLKEGAWTPAFLAPATINGIRWPQGLMPKLGERLNKVALLRSVRAYATAHDLAQSWVQIGRNPINALSRLAPHIGSVVSLELGPKTATRLLPTFVSLNASSGPGAGYLPPEHGPFHISPNGGGLPNTRHNDGQAALERRYGMLMDLEGDIVRDPDLSGSVLEMARFRESARQLMYNPEIEAIFTFNQEVRNLYGNSGFGNACAAARNLLRANKGTRFVQINFGSWDHHGNIYQANANLQLLSRQFDDGVSRMMDDLERDGLLDKTLIVAMGEFGRTVGPLNATAGRDHHVQQSVFVAGARIRGGRVIGQTDALGAVVTEPEWARQREIRPEDIEATIYSALSIDYTTLRRDYPLGRGFEYVPGASEDLYGPIYELWG